MARMFKGECHRKIRGGAACAITCEGVIHQGGIPRCGFFVEYKVPLSARAVKLWERVKRGEFYRPHRNPPAAMKELEDAGLVDTIGRAMVIERCYVPAEHTGLYKPASPERFRVLDWETRR